MIWIVVGLMVLMNAAGLVTTTGVVLQKLHITSPTAITGLQDTPFYAIIIASIGLLAGLGGIVISTLTRGSAETAIRAGVATAVILFFIADLITIVSYYGSNPEWAWIGWLIYLILAPFIVIYILAAIDWIGKHD